MIAEWSHVTEGWQTRVVAATPMVRIGECVCTAASPPGSAERICDGFEIVFPRRGVFAKDSEGREELGDPNWAVTFRPGEVYRTRRMFHYGFDCRWVQFSPALQLAAVGEAAAERRDARARPVRTSARVYLMQRMFTAHEEGDSLAMEEAAIAVIGSVLREAYGADHREPMRAWHSEQADDAKMVMAARFRQRLSLEEIGRAVHVSPYHLCRVFRRETGVSIHRYLTGLRLRAGLDEIMEGETDLSMVALRTGFSSHSHFTSAFRKEFGVSPSELRGRRAWRSRMPAAG